LKSMKVLLPFALYAAKIPPVLKALNNEKVQTVLFGMVRKVENAVEAGMSALKGGRP